VSLDIIYVILSEAIIQSWPVSILKRLAIFYRRGHVPGSQNQRASRTSRIRCFADTGRSIDRVSVSPLAKKGYTSPMNHETLEQIQTKIAFLERASAELSDVVFGLHKEIQALEAKVEALTDRLSNALSDESPRSLEQERPPHY
jgi:uncharacterized coiled-coil protein SlyX